MLASHVELVLLTALYNVLKKAISIRLIQINASTVVFAKKTAQFKLLKKSNL